MASHQGRLFAGTGSCQGRVCDVDPNGTLGRVYAIRVGQIVSHEHDVGGGWTYLAVVRRGAKFELYINGCLSAWSAAPKGRVLNISNGEPLLIGIKLYNEYTCTEPVVFPVVELAIALGLAACRQGRRVRFFTAAPLVNRLEELHKQYQMERFLTQLDKADLLICDELGYLTFSRTGAELLFQVFADRYERGSLLVTSNLAFSEWVQVFQGERMTAALLDRLTHHCHIFEMNGESYRFKQSVQKGKVKKK